MLTYGAVFLMLHSALTHYNCIVFIQTGKLKHDPRDGICTSNVWQLAPKIFFNSSVRILLKGLL